MVKNVYDRVGQYGLYGLLEGSDRQGNGKTWFVDSNSGNAANTGTDGQGESWDLPFSTVNYAVSQCTNQANDVILVASNHTETIEDTSPLNESGTVTDEFCVDKEGVSIIGMGTGTARPTFTLATNTDATLEIRAANVTLKNLIVVSNVVDAAAGIDISNGNDGVLIENCEIRDGGTAVLELVLGITISASADDTTIRGCQFYTTATNSGCLSAIKTEGVALRLSIYDNTFLGDWNAQVMDLDAAKVTNLVVRDNLINDIDAGVAEVIDTDASSTGIITGNTIHVGLPGIGTITAAACLIGPNSITYDEGGLGLTSLTPVKGTCSKTYVNWTAAEHDLFQIHGVVSILWVVGVVKVTLKTATMNMALDAESDDPGGGILVLASNLDVTDDAAGTLYTINDTFGGALVATTTGVVVDVQNEPFVMNTGTIFFTCGGEEDGGGSIEWSVGYTALSEGAYITPAATT